MNPARSRARVFPFCGRVTFPGNRSQALNRQRYDAPRGLSIFGGFALATGPQENTHVAKMGKLTLRAREAGLGWYEQTGRRPIRVPVSSPRAQRHPALYCHRTRCINGSLQGFSDFVSALLILRHRFQQSYIVFGPCAANYFFLLRHCGSFWRTGLLTRKHELATRCRTIAKTDCLTG